MVDDSPSAATIRADRDGTRVIDPVDRSRAPSLDECAPTPPSIAHERSIVECIAHIEVKRPNSRAVTFQMDSNGGATFSVRSAGV